MKMNKTLTSIVLAGALALGGCSGKVYDSRYEFNSMLGTEQVEFKTNNSQTIQSSNCRKRRWKNYDLY